MMTFGKKLTAIVLCGTIATGAAASTLSQAWAFTGKELAAQAKLTLDEARAIALKVFAGEIASEELEKEKGGSGLRYSFDIKRGTKTYEVGVDAETGAVVENQPEGKNPDPAYHRASANLRRR
jgi:uncharacterized membrane protein YkoI